MLSPRLLAALLVAVPLLAGCVSPASNVDPAAVKDGLDLLPADTPLWDDKQNAPHPAFGWPTITRPATGMSVPAWWEPIAQAELPETIKGLEHLAKAPDEVTRGGGIALFGRIAVVPGFGAPTSILDISDPSAPKLLSQIENKQGAAHRGAAFIAYPNGTLVFVVSTPKNVEVYDVTDPTKPVELPALDARSHKVGVVPGTPIVYNANSRGADGASPLDARTGKGKGVIEIFDLTNPWAPVEVQKFQNGYGCHHIYFWVTPEKQRALCAGIEMTQIIDITDPRNPAVVTNVPVHHGNTALPSMGVVPVFFSHFSILNDDASVLIVGDETGGGGVAACDGPGYAGNLWFYDVKDEKSPKLLGWFDPGPYFAKNPPKPGGFPAGCTAHHGRLVPDPEGKRDLLAMAFYGAGVVLVDFTNPAQPKMLDQFAQGTNTWEVWYYNGYLFTGDLARGLDVLTFR